MNTKYQVEKDWVTKSGFRAVVIMGTLGCRCGYVGVPVGHPLHGISYRQETDCLAKLLDDEPVGKRGVITLLCASATGTIPRSPQIIFDVHGGLTYSDGSEIYPVESDLWWFGYDCGHAGDSPSPEYQAGQRERYPDQPFMWREDFDSEHRDLEYCMSECELLARQIVERTIPKEQP